jgi:hypothetical protein
MLRIKIVDLLDTISRLMIGKVCDFDLYQIYIYIKIVQERKKEIIDGGLWVQFI